MKRQVWSELTELSYCLPPFFMRINMGQTFSCWLANICLKAVECRCLWGLLYTTELCVLVLECIEFSSDCSSAFILGVCHDQESCCPPEGKSDVQCSAVERLLTTVFSLDYVCALKMLVWSFLKVRTRVLSFVPISLWNEWTVGYSNLFKFSLPPPLFKNKPLLEPLSI